MSAGAVRRRRSKEDGMLVSIRRDLQAAGILLAAALLLTVLLAACGGSDAISAAGGTPAAPAATAAAAGAAAGSVAASPGSAGSASPPAKPSAGATPGAGATPHAGGALDPAAVDAQTAKDEASAGTAVLQQFVSPVNAGGAAAAAGLLAPDAILQAEDVTGRVKSLSPDAARIRLAGDEAGAPHLALAGSGSVQVTAADGSDLTSGQYRLTVSLRRESRRDEWRVYAFDLQPQ
jgi:hypothetical protein